MFGRAGSSLLYGLIVAASLVAEGRVISCGAWTELLHSMWGLPGPGTEPASPALAGSFFTTEPPGKLPFPIFFCKLL